MAWASATRSMTWQPIDPRRDGDECVTSHPRPHTIQGARVSCLGGTAAHVIRSGETAAADLLGAALSLLPSHFGYVTKMLARLWNLGTS